MSSDSDDIVEEIRTDNHRPPVYEGAYAFLNPSNNNESTSSIPKPKIIEIASLPQKTKEALDPDFLSVFYQKRKDFPNMIFGPLEMDAESDAFTDSFVVSRDVLKSIRNGIRAILFCILNECPTWPLHFTAYINSHQISRPDCRFIPSSQMYWLDVSEFLVDNLNTIQIIAKSRIPGKYLFAIRMFYSPTDFDCVIDVNKRDHLTFNDWIKIFRETKTEEVESGAFMLSLVCPLGLIHISEPVRGIGCQHLLCFDLTAYLRYVRDCGKWICPVCDQECPYESLRIDDFVTDILKSVPKNCEIVEVKESGQFKPVKFVDLDE